MSYEKILKIYFDQVLREDEFVIQLTNELGRWGFKADNSILAINLCRDEIAQPLIEKFRGLWGDIFNLSSLGALFMAGKTALKAVMHHSPIKDGKERYIFITLPHIAVDESGRIGICRRKGREGDSSACGALASFLEELKERKINLSLDPLDLEQNYLKMRILKELSFGHLPNLLELTKKVREISQRDLEKALNFSLNPQKSDYALISGIQIHGSGVNYIWMAEGYVVVDGVKNKLTLSSKEEAI